MQVRVHAFVEDADDGDYQTSLSFLANVIDHDMRGSTPSTCGTAEMQLTNLRAKLFNQAAAHAHRIAFDHIEGPLHDLLVVAAWERPNSSRV